MSEWIHKALGLESCNREPLSKEDKCKMFYSLVVVHNEPVKKLAELLHYTPRTIRKYVKIGRDLIEQERKDMATKPTKKDTTAPYTYKRGDLVRFELPGKHDSDEYDLPIKKYGIGVVISTDMDAGTLRGHCEIWTGEYYETGSDPMPPIDDRVRSILLYEVPASHLKLIDKVHSTTSISIPELTSSNVLNRIERDVHNLKGIKFS